MKSKPSTYPKTNPEQASSPGLNPIRPPSRWEKLRGFYRHFERFFWDIGGVILLTLALLTTLGFLFPGSTRGLLRGWTHLLLRGFGWGTAWLIVTMVGLGIWFLLKRRFQEEQKKSPPGAIKPREISWGRIFALELAAFSSLGILTLLGGTSLERANAGLDGGIIGWGLIKLLQLILTPIGIGSPWFILILSILFFILGSLSGLGLWRRFVLYVGRISIIKEATVPGKTKEDASTQVLLPEQPSSARVIATPSHPAQEKTPKESRKKAPAEKLKERVLPSIPRVGNLPGLDLLEPELQTKPDEEAINEIGMLIEKTLADFNIPVTVIGYHIGPTVIQFAVQPGYLEKENPNSKEGIERHKIRVANIANLHRDLALALAVDRLRIEAPVPGRAYVGIEVPNSRVMIVRLRPLLESPAFAKQKSPLAIALGRDVSGQPLITDLARMPHLLVAGTTGSGKSVCIISLAVCLILNNPPEALRLVMADPKMVELRRFNGFPHLYGHVETDFKRILLALRWVVVEMDRRYKLLEASTSRDLDVHNAKLRAKGENILPRIVVFIDELADLMLTVPEETESNLIRLAQLARAVGIHLVVATQRPSAQVITGLIKANFPARIAFMVASSMDSRVILDMVGAEKLLGRGDMLFLPPDASNPIRSQGAMVTDQEIEHVKAFWQKSSEGKISQEPAPWDLMAEEEMLTERDGMLDRAIAVVREAGRANTSMLQRKLRIGYPHAARLMEELEALGVVGPPQAGGRDREVYMQKDDDNPGIS